jgi:Tol biopolymer transport system component
VRALLLASSAALCLAAAAPAAAAPDAFNGRIAFTSFRVDPPPGYARSGDVFSVNPDGIDTRRLTTSPAPDRQPDWSPDGRDVAYSIRKPGEPVNYEVARMTAAGTGRRQLTATPEGEASSQPSWLADGSAILYRRSRSGIVSSIWQTGPLGEAPRLRLAPPQSPLYPSASPDLGRLLFAMIRSPAGDADRAIVAAPADGSRLETLFDVPGAYDSAPAWSPDGSRIAFESNADVGGGNPEGDMEIWTMNADGSGATQLTHNALHDEGPAWSPDGTLLAYTSGPDDKHGDIQVMTVAGERVRQLTFYAGPDESPDWQAIPAPRSDRTCGDAATTGAGAHDVRAAGGGLPCRRALALARRWARQRGRARVSGFAAGVTDYGGTQRVVLARRGGKRRQLVAFLYEPPAPAARATRSRPR